MVRDLLLRVLMTSLTSRVGLLLFGSGACALIYQVAWLREMRLIFGASTAASAAVLAIFMGGLGLGSALLGRRADRDRNPLALYARLELVIAVSAAATPFLVWCAREAYVALGGSVELGLGVATAVRLLLAALVLCVPTFAMGGTLPAASRAVETAADLGRRHLAWLYALNTMGAVVGAFVSTFFLLEIYGTRRTLWLAALVNALVALAARSLSRTVGEGAPTAPEGDRTTVRSASSGESHGLREFDGREIAAHASPTFVYVAAALVGFCFLLMELVWYRMLAPLLGGSSFTFGLILAVALLGIGIGGAAYALFAGNRPATLRGFAITCTLEALCIALPYALGDRLALAAALLRPLGVLGFDGLVLAWTLIAALVILPVACVAGVQFPLMIALLGRGRDEVGRHVGLAYAWNTLGAIVGSLAGGFGLLPLLTAPGTWRAVAVLLLALGSIAMVLSLRVQWQLKRLLTPAAVAALALLLLIGATGPTAVWRHSPIGAGRVEFSNSTRNRLLDWASSRRRAVAWEAEGIESSVALTADDGYAFVVNGKTDGSARGDAPTQVMGGLIGAILHPDPQQALVIGLGTGSTAGWLAAVPTMQRVDVVELEPAIVEVARAFAPVNHDALNNPKLDLIIGDAREVLLTTPKRYDIIYSEPSNPYRAGISSLFTREFYAAVQSRLTPHGVFLQWLQAYEVDAQTIRTIYATLAAVFPTVETWHTHERDLLLVGANEPMRYDVARLKERVAQEPYRSAMAAVWRTVGLEGLLSRYGARASLARAIAEREGPGINTDDRTLIEFAFARSVGDASLFDTADLRRVVRRRNEDRPDVSGGDVDWNAVEQERIVQLAVDGLSPQIDPTQPDDQRRRAQALSHYTRGRLDEALAAWRGQSRSPSGPMELLLVAEAMANAGDDAAMPYIAQLRAFQPVEAAGLTGLLRWRQGRHAEAAGALTEAFEGYRGDPWPLPDVIARLLDVAVQVGAQQPELARQLYEALQVPFSARLLDERRQRAALKLAAYVGGDACVRAIDHLEPHVPWDGEFLSERLRCYVDAGDPRATRAEEQLMAFLAAAPLPFGAGLEAPAEYASQGSSEQSPQKPEPRRQSPEPRAQSPD